MIKTAGLFLLMLLKIFGCLLLALFSVFTAVLLLAVFVPVRYDVQVRNERSSAPEEHNPVKNIQVQVKASWLLHLLHISFSYGPSGAVSRIRAAGIDVKKVLAWFSNRKEKRSRKQQKKKKRKNNKKTSHEQSEKIPSQPGDSADPGDREGSGSVLKMAEIRQEQDLKTPPQKSVSGETEQTDREEVQEADLKKPDPDIKRQGQNSAGAETEGKPAAKTEKRKKKKGKKFFSKKSRAKKKKKEPRFRKTGRIRTALERFRKEYTDETNRYVLSHLWKEICYILRKYKPKKLKADLAFSLADPAATGDVSGMLSLLPVIYQYPCSIVPDFTSDKMYIEGSFSIKGKITVYVFLFSFLRLVCDKKCRSTAKRLMKRG